MEAAGAIWKLLARSDKMRHRVAGFAHILPNRHFPLRPPAIGRSDVGHQYSERLVLEINKENATR